MYNKRNVDAIKITICINLNNLMLRDFYILPVIVFGWHWIVGVASGWFQVVGQLIGTMNVCVGR